MRKLFEDTTSEKSPARTPSKPIPFTVNGKVIADYKAATSLVIKNKWTYLLPLFSILLGFIPAVVSFWLYWRTEQGMFGYPISLFPNPSLAERLLLILQHFPITRILGAISIFGLVGFGFSCIFFLIFIKYLWPILKKHSGIAKLLLFSLLGIIVGIALVFLTYKTSRNSAVVNAGVFIVIVSYILLSLTITSLSLGTFLAYIKNLLKNSSEPITLSALFKSASETFVPIFTLGLILDITSVGFWTSWLLWPQYINVYLLSKPLEYGASLPRVIQYFLLAVHYSFYLVSIFVPFIIVNGERNFAVALKKSLLIFKNFTEKSVKILLSSLVIAAVIIIFYSLFRTDAIIFSTYGLYLQLLYTLLLTINALLLAVVISHFISDTNNSQ